MNMISWVKLTSIRTRSGHRTRRNNQSCLCSGDLSPFLLLGRGQRGNRYTGMASVPLDFEIDGSEIRQRRDLSYSRTLRNWCARTRAGRRGTKVIVLIQLKCGLECINVANDFSERTRRNGAKLTIRRRSRKRGDPLGLWMSSVVETRKQGPCIT